MTEEKLMTLKNHIDTPVLKTIALMNLWGLQTTWSCCSLHYQNPEVKKDHAPVFQIFVKATPESFLKLTRLVDAEEMAFLANSCTFRLVKQVGQEPMVVINGTNMKPAMWGERDSPHYHEYVNMVIYFMNKRLLEFKDEFAEEVTIIDQNEYMKKVMPNWDYAPSSPWTVTKKEALEMP